jgi:polyisoprenoid-binding protein YceI
MIKQGLQLIGALSLFAWTAIGVAAWVQVGDGVQVLFSQGPVEADESDQLLADRIAVLSTDFDELVVALDANLRRIAEAIDDEQEDVAAQSARTQERLSALEAALPSAPQAREAAGALAATLARLEALANADSTHVVPTSQPLVSVNAAPVALEPPPVVVTEPEPEVIAAKVERKRSFLAFDLPSRDFHFEGEQQFEILGDLSRVGFDAKSTLHDFTGISNRVQGSFTVDLAHPENGISGAITVPADSLDTGLAGRDEALREHLDSTEFAELRFEPTSFVATRSDASRLELDGVLGGRLTIRDESREIEVPLRARVDESRRLVLEGEWPLLLSDYGVPIPNQLGVVSVEDEVRVWLRLRSRAQVGSVSH